MAIRQYLAANVRRLLKERDWTQKELAKRAKLSEPMVSGLVNGEHWSGDETVDRIAEVFGVDPAELFRNPASAKLNPAEEFMQHIKTIEKKLDTLLKKH